MNRLENLLLPLIAVVIVGALLLEHATADTVRSTALWFGSFLAVFLVFGGLGRAMRKARAAKNAQRAPREDAGDET